MKSELVSLWSHTNKRRHVQFGLILILMTISSVAEIVSIGAVIPFLGVLTSPEKIFELQEMQPIIDFFQFISPDELILPFTAVFIVSALITGIIRVALLYVTTRFSYAAGADIAIDVYRRTLYQDYATHIAQNSSEIINSVTTKTNAVVSGVLNPALIFISSLVLVVFIVLTLLFIDPVVALISFSGFGLFYWLIILYTRRQLKENSECIAIESTHIIKSIQEGLGGIRDVIIDGNQEFYSRIYRNADQPLRRALGNNQFINGSPRYIMESIGMILIAGIAYFMSLQEGGVITVIPILGALALGAQRILPALQQLYGAYTNIKSAHASFNDVLTLLEQPLPENVSLLVGTPIVLEKSIRINNIGFKYSRTNKEILKNISMTIGKGSVIGFIGTTGSGKSTLLDIIMGLLSPTSGEIFIDDTKIDSKNQHLWRNHIAHVPQSIFLSDATIEENIALGIPREEVNQDKIKSAAKQAQLDELIEGLPEKYQTIVGERGVRLSGGQRQRIGIARAIYKQPQVLIFDEATSALDNQTETEVMKSIYSLKKDLTILIIAHRVTTLRGCDVIYELQDGKIARFGDYNKMVKNLFSN